MRSSERNASPVDPLMREKIVDWKQEGIIEDVEEEAECPPPFLDIAIGINDTNHSDRIIICPQIGLIVRPFSIVPNRELALTFEASVLSRCGDLVLDEERGLAVDQEQLNNAKTILAHADHFLLGLVKWPKAKR